MSDYKCRYFNQEAKCEKEKRLGHIQKCCGGVPLDDYKSRFEVIEPEEACEKKSIYGNEFFTITQEDLQALMDGKVLCCVDEYGTFIRLETGKEGQ